MAVKIHGLKLKLLKCTAVLQHLSHKMSRLSQEKFTIASLGHLERTTQVDPTILWLYLHMGLYYTVAFLDHVMCITFVQYTCILFLYHSEKQWQNNTEAVALFRDGAHKHVTLLGCINWYFLCPACCPLLCVGFKRSTLFTVHFCWGEKYESCVVCSVDVLKKLRTVWKRSAGGAYLAHTHSAHRVMTGICRYSAVLHCRAKEQVCAGGDPKQRSDCWVQQQDC